MKERGWPAYQHEVRAILVINPQPVASGPGGAPCPIVVAYPLVNGWDFQSADGATQALICCPFGVPGDRLCLSRLTLEVTEVRVIFEADQWWWLVTAKQIEQTAAEAAGEAK